jgi:CheY-like chemotaxis protein
VHSPSRPPPARSPAILCVDDESAALFLRRTVLERAGYRVFTALNAEEALQIFGSREISLVISDHLLPGVTGTEMARTMKLAQPRLPILLLSGVADAPAGTENTDKFLSKSEGPEKLLAVVAELLRYRRLHVLVGAFSAEIVCDTLKTPDLWHYVVQRVGSVEIVCWSQEPSEQAALSAATRQMKSMNKSLATQNRA